MAEVFLSYSREDQPTARHFADALRRVGISVWWDQSLRSGEAFDRVTEKALEEARAVIVLWSKASVESRWVRAEATQADRNGTLLPVMIGECKRPIMFELTHTADLSGWAGEPEDARWLALLEDLRALLGGPAAVAKAVPAHEPAASRQRRGFRGLALLAALVVLGGGLWLALRQQGTTEASRATANQAAGVTLAVLPFANISTDPDQEYFADGITEEILNSLARISGMRVTARTSSFYFKGRNEDMRVIGQKLAVDHLLEGSVRRSGDQLRITVQLIQARDGFHQWSKTYDRTVQDIFKVQEDIARDVAQALQIALGVGDLGQAPGMTRNVDAYEAYLSGLSQISQGTESGDQVVASFRRAVELDRNFAQAWAALASQLYENSVVNGEAPPPEVLQAQAEFARLMPDAVALVVQEAWLHIERLDWGKAAQSIQEARRRTEQKIGTPVGAEGVPVTEASFLRAVDQANRSLPIYASLLARDPLGVGMDADIALGNAAAGRGEQARAEVLRVQGLLNEHGIRSVKFTFHSLPVILAYIQERGMREQLARQFTAADGSRHDSKLYELLDKPDQARRELQRLAGTPASSIVDLFMQAAWAAHFGEPQLALQFMQQMRTMEQGRGLTLMPLLWQPVMKEVRALQGFKDLVRELKLVEYWRTSGWGDHCRAVDETDFTCS